MIKQTWNISEGEKNRILNLHESATKLQYLNLEQDSRTVTSNTVFPKQNLQNQFKFGEYQSDNAKNAISSLKPQINDFIKKNGGKQFTVNINAGESNVTNPKGFETKGSLALARANSVKQYFQEIFPDLIKNGTLVIKSPEDVSKVVLGKTPYDKTKGDNKNPEKIKLYNQEQFVTFDIVGSGQVSETIKDFCRFSQDASGMVAGPEDGFLSYNYNLNIDSISTGKLLTVFLYPVSVPDLLVVTLGNEIKSTGFVGDGDEVNTGYLATILGNEYLLKGKQIPSVFPSDIVPMSQQEANELFYSPEKIKRNLQHVLKKVDWSLPKDKLIQSIKFYKFKTNPVKNKKGIITLKKPEGVSEINIKVYSPIGTTLWSLKGSCQQ